MKQTKTISKTFTILLIISIFIISGCVDDPTTGPVTDKDFKTGTEGIIFDFSDNAPPDTVKENSNFLTRIDVQNKGAYKSDKAYFSLSVENDYIGIKNQETEKSGKACSNNNECEEGQTCDNGKCKSPPSPNNYKILVDLRGKSVAEPKGERESLQFEMYSKDVGIQKTRHETTMLVTGCYEYKTEIIEDICLDTDVYGDSVLAKVCEAKDIILSDQGSPVAIIKIEIDMLPEQKNGKVVYKPLFSFHIKNKGKGNVVSHSVVENACIKPTEMKRESWNRVKISEIKIAGVAKDITAKDASNEANNQAEDVFICDDTEIKLIDEEGIIKCEYKHEYMEDVPAFTTQIKAVFEYGYTDTKSTNIIIERKNE